MEINKLYRVAVACQKLKISRTTVNSAIDRGEIEVHKTGCGLPLVALMELRRWRKTDRKRGPKS